jgi:hypothetical protein
MLVIWENTENCKEGKVVAKHVFPVSSAAVFYLG